jgi:MFS family permease
MSTYPRAFVLALAISLVGTMSNGLVTPILPVFVEDRLGGGDTLVGLVVALAPAFSLCGGLLAGPYIDGAGRRVTATAGLSIALIGALILIVADSVAITVLARSVFGVGAGITAAATITWAVDQVPPDRRGRALSVFGLTVWIGLSAGPQVGQALFDAAGFVAVWVAIAVLEGGGLVLALLGREPRERPPEGPPARRKLVPLGAGRPAVLIAMAAYGEGVIMAFLVLHLIERGVPEGAGVGGAASVYTIFAASVLVLRVVGGALVDRYRPEMVASAAFAAEALGLVAIAVASSFSVAALGAAAMGAGFAVLFPSLAVVATHNAADEERGAALAAFGSAFGAGLTAGALLGGAIASVGGTGLAHLSGALAAGAAGTFLLVAGGTRRPHVALVERAP